VSVTGVLFSLWVTFASGYQSVYQSVLLLMIGVPIYAFLKAQRERAGLVPEPIDRIDDDLDAIALPAGGS